jgi:hypothetical protein
MATVPTRSMRVAMPRTFLSATLDVGSGSGRASGAVDAEGACEVGSGGAGSVPSPFHHLGSGFAGAFGSSG